MCAGLVFTGLCGYILLVAVQTLGIPGLLELAMVVILVMVLVSVLAFAASMVWRLGTALVSVLAFVASMVWRLGTALVSVLAFVANLPIALCAQLCGLLSTIGRLLNRVVQWSRSNSTCDTGIPLPIPATITARRPVNHDFAAPTLTPQGHWKLQVLTQCVLMCTSGSPAHEVAQRCEELWRWAESREHAVQEVLLYATGCRHGNAEALVEDMLARVLANDRVADEDSSDRVRAGFDESVLTYRGLVKLLAFKLLLQMVQDGRTEQDVQHEAQKAWRGDGWEQVVQEVYRFNSARLQGCSALKLQYLLARLLVSDHQPAPVLGVALPSPTPLPKAAPHVSDTYPVEAR